MVDVSERENQKKMSSFLFRPSRLFTLCATSFFAIPATQAEEKTLPEIPVSAERMLHGVFRSESSATHSPATVEIIDFGKTPDGGMDRTEDAFKFAGIGDPTPELVPV